MLPAKEVMTKDVYTIKPDAPVYDAVRLIAEKKVSGLPVVDEENNLVSIITEKDLLRLLVEGDESLKVKDFMTKDEIISFDAEDNIIVICEFFINSNVRRVPVVEGDKLVGVISRGDIIKLVLAEKDKAAA